MPTTCDPWPGNTQASSGCGSASVAIDPDAVSIAMSHLQRTAHGGVGRPRRPRPIARRVTQGLLVEAGLCDLDGLTALIVAAGGTGVVRQPRRIALRTKRSLRRYEVQV